MGGELRRRLRLPVAGDSRHLLQGRAAAGRGLSAIHSLVCAPSWSGPPDSSLRNQLTTEAFYRLQLTQNLQVTPALQFTIHPSNTLETDTLWVVSALRMRLSL